MEHTSLRIRTPPAEDEDTIAARYAKREAIIRYNARVAALNRFLVFVVGFTLIAYLLALAINTH